MKLSQAIREGCKLAPRQMRHAFFDYEQPPSAACALGAAALAAGVRRDTVGIVGRLRRRFPDLNQHVQRPGRKKSVDQLFIVVQYMNDNLNWSRERISGWLEERAF